MMYMTGYLASQETSFAQSAASAGFAQSAASAGFAMSALIVTRGMVLISTYFLSTTGASFFEFSGLSVTSSIYTLYYMIRKPTVSSLVVLILPNGNSGTMQSTHIFATGSAANVSAQALSTWQTMSLSSNAPTSGMRAVGIVTIYDGLSANKVFMLEQTTEDDSNIVLNSQASGIWRNSAQALSSIRISCTGISNTINSAGLGSGSFFALYRTELP